jgi:Phytanoyl-CoA dioxygenase (PhyH)
VGAVEIERFVADGFVKLEGAVPREVGDAARTLLWRQIGLSPQDPAAWKEPVIWAADLTGEGPLGELIGSARLARALDELCGVGGWVPRGQLGMVPVRFPRLPPADDRGWHIDANVAQPDGRYRCGVQSQTMLLLVLLSDVGPADAPTRIRVGSQRDAAAALAGRTLDSLAAGPLVDAASAHRPLAHATGQPGDIYLVHPLTVHAADEHRGDEPRFMAQTPVFLTEPLAPDGGNALAQAIAVDIPLADVAGAFPASGTRA